MTTKITGMMRMIANGLFLLTLSASWQTAAYAGGYEDPATRLTLGQPGKAEDVTRTIQISTKDMKFMPVTLDVRAGETVRFMVTNMGPSQHEFVIGPDAGDHHAQDEAREVHEAAGETNEIELAVGETRELIWTFGAAQQIEFACHQPGHYEAGMLGKIIVKP